MQKEKNKRHNIAFFAARMATVRASDPSGPTRYSGVVLVVEDNPINQLVASEMLQLVGAVFVIAADGVEALEAIDRRQFDLVLMDIDMPRMDGIEATEKIRHRERMKSLPQLPIVALSANTSEEDRKRCRAAGMNDFLTKPVKTEQIAALLARYLLRRTC